MALLGVLFCLVAALYLFYRWATLKYKTFEERGIVYNKPQPLIGNSGDVLRNKTSFFKRIISVYRENKKHKIFGYFNFREPMFIVMDPAIIKKITVQDFDHFPNHLQNFSTKDELLLTSMLSIMKDQRWKDMRATLTPVFTVSKMRSMFALMNECFDESLSCLRAMAREDGCCEFEMKDYFTRLSNDIIASTAFGLSVNSYKDRNNEFYSVGQSITASRKQVLKFMIASAAPKLMELLGFKLFAKEKTDYFMRLVLDAMKQRRDSNISRPDMIQLLMEAKQESTQNWSDEELVAQCFIFFFAAFENNSIVICTTCNELMENPDIQQRLYEECLEVHEELNGAPLNYDAVQKMKYLDMVLSESLRKWTLAPFTDRCCSKDYALKDNEGKLIFQFKAGDRIWLPIVGLHWDEEYFEKPEVFDPERFSDENKHSINPYTYLPFGVGPRSCIANRYALMQAKAILYHLVLNFKLERSAKSVKSLLDEARGFTVNPPNGFWLRFVARKRD